MLGEHLFVREETLPSWFVNALGEFLSLATPAFQVQRLVTGLGVQVVASADSGAAVVAIGGLWRWNEATVSVNHPGGVSAAYDVFVTAAADEIVNTPAPFTDITSRSFALQIKASGATPAIVAGSVDVYRKVARCWWNGSRITWLVQTIGRGLASPWEALSLPAGVSAAGARAAAARMADSMDSVQIKGKLLNGTGADILAGNTIATVPEGLRPGDDVQIAAGSGFAWVRTSGAIQPLATVPAGTFYWVDGQYATS